MKGTKNEIDYCFADYFMGLFGFCRVQSAKPTTSNRLRQSKKRTKVNGVSHKRRDNHKPKTVHAKGH